MQLKINWVHKSEYTIYWISFIGFSTILAFLASINLESYSRLFTIPVRLFTILLMLLIIAKKRFNPANNSVVYVTFIIFFLLYFFKIILEYFKGTKDLYMPVSEFFMYSIVYAIIPFFFFSQKKENTDYNRIFDAIYNSGILFVILSTYVYVDVKWIENDGKFWRSLLPISPLIISYSSITLIGICLSRIVFEKINSQLKKKMIIGILIGVVPFIISGSRGAILALFLPFIFGLIYYYQYKIKLKHILITLFSIFGMIILAEMLGGGLIDRISEMFEKASNGVEVNARIEIWKMSFNEFLSNPIFGGHIQTSNGRYSHNLLLESLMATGIIGFFPFAILTVYTLKKSFQIIKTTPHLSWIFILFMQAFFYSLLSGTLSKAIDLYIGMALVFSVSFNRNLEMKLTN